MFCPQTFDTAAAKDDHILEHFAQETCLRCDRNLIRIGGSLYTKHDTSICVGKAIKSEDHLQMPTVVSFTTENHSECVLNSSKYVDGLEGDDDFSSTQILSIKEEQLDTFNENSDDSIDRQNYSSDFETNELNIQPICSLIVNSQEHQSTSYNTEPSIEVKVEAGPGPLETRDIKLFIEHTTDEQNVTKIICDLCGMEFGSKSNLSKHKMKLHYISSQSHKKNCNACGRIFDTEADRDVHRTECSGEQGKRFRKQSSFDMQCDLCSRLLKTDQSYRTHMKRVHGRNVTKYKCKRCRNVFNKEFSLQNHQCNKKLIEIITCNFCGKNFIQKASLENHILRMHSVTDVVCKICKRHFDNQVEYDSHKDECSKSAKHDSIQNRAPCECDICGRQMSNIYTLKKHKTLFHSSPGAIFCSVCGKLFSVADERDEHQLQCELRRKMGTLKLTGKFECDYCHRVIKRKSELRRHMVMKHAPGGHSLKCKSCKTIFLQESSLQSHKCKGRNTSYKDLVPCECCGKIVSRGALKTHQIAFHSPPGTIFCRTCFKIFPSDAELLAHRPRCKKVKFQSPRECKSCGKVMSSAGTLSRHKITQHSAPGTIFCKHCAKRFKTVEELNAHMQECSLKRKMQKIKKRNQLPNDQIE